MASRPVKHPTARSGRRAWRGCLSCWGGRGIAANIAPWGQNVDTRVQPQDPQKVASAIRPDYSLGSHVAALGLAFSAPTMGSAFADGVFVGQHGSWNRGVPVGYRVSFVPFRSGRPAGPPVDFVTGFLGMDGRTSWAAGRSNRGPAGRADRRRRPLEHHLACDPDAPIAATPGAAPAQRHDNECGPRALQVHRNNTRDPSLERA